MQDYNIVLLPLLSLILLVIYIGVQNKQNPIDVIIHALVHTLTEKDDFMRIFQGFKPSRRAMNFILILGVIFFYLIGLSACIFNEHATSVIKIFSSFSKTPNHIYAESFLSPLFIFGFSFICLIIFLITAIYSWKTIEKTNA